MPTANLLWVWFCAYFSLAGWTLSALHQLNRAGYLVRRSSGWRRCWPGVKKTSATLLPSVRLQKISAAFLPSAALLFWPWPRLAFAGGAIYAPNNYERADLPVATDVELAGRRALVLDPDHQ